MKIVIQRVTRASVTVDDAVVGAIGVGAVLLVGVERGDTATDADVAAHKLGKLRFFPGATPMDRSLLDIGGSALLVSQFTLAGALAKGNRPGFTDAEEPARAEELYLRVAQGLRAQGIAVATGRFRALMQVELVNDGPVTLLLTVRDGRVL